MTIFSDQQLNKKSILLLFCIAAFTASSVAFIHQQLDSPIVGTWISVDDQNNKWVFTNDDMAKNYYENELSDTYSYRISSTSPQCGEQVQTGPKIEFLELTDVHDGDQQCYYINGLDSENLSLSPFGRSNILVFEKQ